MKKTGFFLFCSAVLFSLNSCVSRTSSEKWSKGSVQIENAMQVPTRTPQGGLSKENSTYNLPQINSIPLSDKVEFDWPVDKARLTRGFLPRKRKPHLGIDLASPKGTPIFASAEGIVIYAGHDFRGYGKMVLIESSNSWATLYAHLDKIYITEGQKVQMGDVLGSMGRSGRATGTHLHFEMRKNKAPVNPLVYLPSDEPQAQRSQANAKY